jgi:hypothetical protein
MVQLIEVHSDLRISDLYWLFFTNAIRKLIYARWVVTIVLILLVASYDGGVEYPFVRNRAAGG